MKWRINYLSIILLFLMSLCLKDKEAGQFYSSNIVNQ